LALPPRPQAYNSRNNPNWRTPRKPVRPHRINEEINVSPIRIVGEEDESRNGVVPTPQALSWAKEKDVDLVEIAPQAVPPVCRIIEYSKFRYEQKKKEKEVKGKHKIAELKEVRFGPNTDEHDFNFKVRHAENFLKEGDKVKAYVVFHGRTIVHKDRGEKLLREFAKALEGQAKVELDPKLEGKRMFMILIPAKK